jgi:hypothetical protein
MGKRRNQPKKVPKAAFPKWAMQWLRSAKPTEWIVAVTGCIGVVATVTGAIILLASGLLDAKRSEVEVKRSEIAMQNVKLELEQRDLLARRATINEQIVQQENVLKSKELEIAGVRGRLGTATADLSKARENLATYVENERALALLTSYSRSLVERKTKIGALECDVTLDPSLDVARVAIKGVGDSEKPVVSADKKKLLAAARGLTKLNHLVVENVCLDADDIRDISQLRGLRFLDLVNCGLTDAHMQSLKIDKNVNYLRAWGQNYVPLIQ